MGVSDSKFRDLYSNLSLQNGDKLEDLYNTAVTNRFDINRVSDSGGGNYTILAIAVKKDNKQNVEFILSKKPNLNVINIDPFGKLVTVRDITNSENPQFNKLLGEGAKTLEQIDPFAFAVQTENREKIKLDELKNSTIYNNIKVLDVLIYNISGSLKFEDIALLLIANGATNEYISGSGGFTALMRASKYGLSKVVQALIAKGANVNAVTQSSPPETALSRAIAARNKSTDMAIKSKLETIIADLKAAGALELEAAIAKAAGGAPPAAAGAKPLTLINEDDYYVKGSQYAKLYTLAQGYNLAAFNEELEQALRRNFTIDRLSDIQTVLNRSYTILACATNQTDYIDIAQAILDKGADINAILPSSRNNTALDLAVNKNPSSPMVGFLQSKGARLFKQIDPLTYAVQNRDKELLRGEVISADITKKTRLLYNNLESLEFQECAIILINSNVEVNFSNDNGITLLMRASKYGLDQVVTVLLAKGADASFVANNGETALGRAKAALTKSKDNPDLTKRLNAIITALESAGATDTVPPIQSDATIELGGGSSGTVYKPALPNTNFTTNLDKSVTKIFTDKAEYDKALSKIALVQRMFSPYDLVPYKRNLKRSNISGMQGSKQVFAVRMPYLGENIENICDDKNGSLVALKKISSATILIQIAKCLEKLLLVNLNGYLHRDIRTENIVIDTDSGVITIIDFDNITSKADTLVSAPPNLPIGGYWNPPEALLHKTVPSSLTSNYNKFFPISYYGSLSNPDDGPILKKSQPALFAQLQEIVELNLKDRSQYDNVMQYMVETFDSFGIAWTFIKLLNKLYPASTETNIVAMKDTVLKPLGAFKQAERKTLAEVYQTAVAIVRAAAATVAVGGYRRRSRSRSRSRSNKRKSPKRSGR